MPLGGINAGWDNSVPAGSENAGQGAQRIRSTKTSVQEVLDSEHLFPAGGGANTGAHRLGSGRAFVVAESAISSSDTNGRLAVASDTSRFFHVGSGGTSLIGGPGVLSIATFPGAVPQRHYWAAEVGTVVVNSVGSINVTIPNSGYSGSPYVFISIMTASAASAMASLQGVPTASRFTVQTFLPVAGVPSTATVAWMSVGTRVLGG